MMIAMFAPDGARHRPAELRCLRPSNAILVGCLLIALIVVCHPALAAKPVPESELAVDVVSVKGGPRFYGAVLGREEDGRIALAVRREWLKRNRVQVYDEGLRDETAETKTALTELHDRIADWRKARNDVPALEAFLKKENERIEKDLQTLDAGRYEEAAPFMVLDFAPAKIERVLSQIPSRRAIAQTAWQEQLSDVETRSAVILAQELKKQQIALVDDPDELLEMLPVRRESETAWVARKALVEYQFRKALDFQGTGDFVFPATDKVDGAQGAKLIEGLIKSLTSGTLKDLFDLALDGSAKRADAGGIEKWLATASQSAQSADVLGFRVTRVEPNLDARQITVESRFVARFPGGDWRTVWQHAETADASKIRADQEQQIMQDPQVRKVLDLVQSVGLTDEDQVKQAIRFGAATMDCQKIADSRFFQFRDRYLRRLDGPVLRVAAPPSKAPRKF
jgi:hypothetical protein